MKSTNERYKITTTRVYSFFWSNTEYYIVLCYYVQGRQQVWSELLYEFGEQDMLEANKRNNTQQRNNMMPSVIESFENEKS